MTLDTAPFDAAEHLDVEGQADLISDALASGDGTYIRHALNTAARARGMSHVAREAGVTREALYKALSPGGDPRLSTLLGVLKALDLKLTSVASHVQPSAEMHALDASAELTPRS